MVDRYDFNERGDLFECVDGCYVHFKDYAARLAERDALVAQVEEERSRFDWYFGPDSQKSSHFMSTYFVGTEEKWSPDRWREAIDAARKEQQP